MLADVPHGAHVLIDANIFVYHFSAPTAFSDAPSQFLERVETGQIRGTTSSLVLIETLHRLMILLLASNDADFDRVAGLTVYGLP